MEISRSTTLGVFRYSKRFEETSNPSADRKARFAPPDRWRKPRQTAGGTKLNAGTAAEIALCRRQRCGESERAS
jgi:hypothetical protein